MISKIKSKIKNNNIIKNSLIIISGQTLSSLISFINTFLLLKAVGIYGNGIIAIVQTYSNIFNGIFNFQSYNAMIKFGAEALEKNDEILFKKYMKQAFLQDLLTAILAIIVGYISVDFISKFMMWDSETVYFIKIYLITIIFTITGSIRGFLRLFDEFKVESEISIKTTLYKLLMMIIGISLGLKITYYIIVEILISILGNIMLFYKGYKCLKKNKLEGFVNVSVKFDKEFTMFNFHNNIVSTLDMPVGQLTTLIINKFLGISEVGIYNILVKLGGLITRVTSPVTQALLPEISKIVAKGNVNHAFKIIKKIFLYTMIYGVGMILIIILTHKYWLGLFIPVNIENIVLLTIYILYILASSAVSGIHLLFICLNLVKYNLPIIVVCNTLYLIMLFYLGQSCGLVGIILALIAQVLMVVMIKYLVMIKKVNLNMQ